MARISKQVPLVREEIQLAILRLQQMRQRIADHFYPYAPGNR